MGILSPLYDKSFDGVSFFELVSAGFYPGMDVETEGTLYNLGGGVHKYVDMGQAPGIFSIVVGVEAAQASALIGKRGDTGTLVWSRGSQTATLLDILPTEADAFDAQTVTLKFFSDDFPSGITPSGAMITESSDVMITESSSVMVIE